MGPIKALQPIRRVSIQIPVILLLLFFSYKASAQAIAFAGTDLEVIHHSGYRPFTGWIWLKNGKKIEGNIELLTHTADKDMGGGALKTFIYIDSFEVNGQDYAYREVAFYSNNKNLTAKDFCEFNKKGELKLSKNEEENFQPGYIMMDNNNKTEGLVAIRNDGNYGYVLFAKSMDDKVQVSYPVHYDFYEPYRMKHVFQKIDGREVEYLPMQKAYAPANDKKLSPAYIITKDGKRTEGKGRFDELREDGLRIVRRSHYAGLYFRPENGYAAYYPASSLLSAGLLQDEPKECVAFRNYFYDKAELAKEFEKAPEGRLALTNGTVLKGKIKEDGQDLELKGFSFMDDAGNYFRKCYGDPDVLYYGITENGKERKYIRVNYIYTEWFYSDQKVSYLKNPFPTHERKGLNNTVMATAGAVAADLNYAVIEAAKKDAVDKIKKGDLNSAASGMKKAAEISGTLNSVGALNREGVGLFNFKEYLVYINGRNPVLVYKKNMQEEMDKLKTVCPALSNIKKNKLEDVDDIDDVVKFLNESNCF